MGSGHFGSSVSLVFYLTELSSMSNFMKRVKMKAFGSRRSVTWVLVILGAMLVSLEVLHCCVNCA